MYEKADAGLRDAMDLAYLTGQRVTDTRLMDERDVRVEKSEFQMRDLRAKAGTDKAESSGDILQARDQLGHTTVVMTEQYIRNRKGKKVSPTK